MSGRQASGLCPSERSRQRQLPTLTPFQNADVQRRLEQPPLAPRTAQCRLKVALSTHCLNPEPALRRAAVALEMLHLRNDHRAGFPR